MSNIYEVVGYESRKGISKRTGVEYEIDVYHCVSYDPIDERFGYGRIVESFAYNPLINGKLKDTISVGDQITPYFTRGGYVSTIIKHNN